MEPRWQLRILIGIIGLSLAFLLPGIAKYHGDERFYTDAAIRMSQTGDYFTPYAANGALRFAKPIAPYWAVLAGYSVFGINLTASRVAFLIAGCLVILFTYRLSLVLFNRPPEAMLAALIVASNVQFLTISIRSTPDALLCLFVLLSLLGFARIIFQKDNSWMSYALAWVGAGMAVQTRGLPGVAVALFPLLFCLLARRGKTRLRELFEWKATTLGVLAGISWFALMILLHGRALLDGFYYDQVSGKVMSSDMLAPLKNLQAYTVGVLRHFLPWSGLLLIGLLVNRRVAASHWLEHRDKCWFLAGWYLFILAPFIFGGMHRTRYMLVAYPLLAVLLSTLLSRYAEEARFERWQTRLLTWGGAAFAVGGISLLAAGVVISPRVAAAGVMLLGVSVAVWVVARRRLRWGYALSFAALPIAAFWANELFLRPAFASSPAPALTARLVPDEAMRERVYALNLDSSYEGQMRVLSGGRLKVVPMSLDALEAFVTIENPIVFRERDKHLLADYAGAVEQTGFASRKWRMRDFIELFDKETRAAKRSSQLEPYYILFPEPVPNSFP